MLRKLTWDLLQQEVGGAQLKRLKYSDLCDILPKVAREAAAGAGGRGVELAQASADLISSLISRCVLI